MSIERVLHFLTTGIWRMRLRDLTPQKGFLIRFLRVCILSTREFFKDKCVLRASALTYYTLLSIVPVLAMAFGIAKGFGLQESLEKIIREKMQALGAGIEATQNGDGAQSMNMQQVADLIIEFTNNMLGNVRGGLVAGIGVAILFYVTIKVLSNIEKSFNDIWGVGKARTIPRKFADYLAFMLISPFFLVMASSFTVMITTNAQGLIENASLWGWADTLAASSLRLVPLSLIWLLFAFTYLFMPNTKVKLQSGLIGGIAAGTLFYLVQSLYVALQIGVSRYGAVYGSFAALPFLLFWLQTSWLIVLFGAEIAFAYQNIETYEFEPDCRNASHYRRRVVAIRILNLCLKRFKENEEPLSAEDFSHSLEQPVRLVREVLQELVNARLLTRILQDGKRAPLYQPATDPCKLDLASVLARLDDQGSSELPLSESETQSKIEQAIHRFREAASDSEANINVDQF